MPKIPKYFIFVLIAAFILGAAFFAYINAPEPVKKSFMPDIKSGYSVSQETTSGTPPPSVLPRFPSTPPKTKH